MEFDARPVTRASACVAVAAGVLVMAAASLGTGARASADASVGVFPIAGSRYNLPRTQISFRGLSAGQLGSIQVVGSKTGVHVGRVLSDSDSEGASFVPSKPFAAGETVTVTTGLNVVGGNNGTFSFGIAATAGLLSYGRLPLVQAGSNGVQHFHSRPDLRPASVTVNENHAPAAEGDIFVAPQFGPSQDGPMILDPYGNLVWFLPRPVSQNTLVTDFRVQHLFGQPVLTWWQGNTNSGHGRGLGMIFDHNYRQIATVRAGNGLEMGLHEFLVTPQGDAWINASSPVHLPGVARPVIDSVVQEIDIRTGLVLFEWHALDHVKLSDSYNYGPRVSGHILDPYHLNSVSIANDGNPIVSMRNTSAVYEIDRNTGQVLWTLGGKHSSFRMGAGTMTWGQHDALQQPDGTITIFDDGAGPPKVHQYSRGMVERVDTTHQTATLVRAIAHSPQLSANFEGSVQLLPDGNSVLDWGQQPYVSEHDANGHQIFDARFTVPTSSYRAYRFPWSAQPPTTPALAISTSANGTVTPYASWNGATDVAGWRLLGGTSARSLAPVRRTAKHRFESTIPAYSGDSYFAVQTLSASGRVLATSRTVTAHSRLAVYGGSAFVAPSALAGVPVSCLAPRPCRVVTSVWWGHTLVARSGRERLPAGGGGVLYFRLSPPARRALARHHRLPVSLTAQDASGLKATTALNLVPFHTSGGGPRRSYSPTHSLRIVGGTDFVSWRGVGGVLAACGQPTTCTVKLTVSAGSAVIATTGRENLGANELGYVIFKLSAAGRALLARAGGNQLPVAVTLSSGGASARANVALVGFR